MTSQNVDFHQGERVIRLRNLPTENRPTVKKIFFLNENVFYNLKEYTLHISIVFKQNKTKIYPPIGGTTHAVATPPWLINFAKIHPEMCLTVKI